MSPDLLNFPDLNKIVSRSVERFRAMDWCLLCVNSSERSLTHALAVRLYEDFGKLSWDVDCEYNRNGDVPKRLLTLKRKISKNTPKKKSAVFPDIVIHKRGSAGPNLLVIEAKKSGSSDKAIAFDREKIRAYIGEFKYSYGLIVTLPAAGIGDVGLEWWRREKGKAVRCRESKF